MADKNDAREWRHKQTRHLPKDEAELANVLTAYAAAVTQQLETSHENFNTMEYQYSMAKCAAVNRADKAETDLAAVTQERDALRDDGLIPYLRARATALLSQADTRRGMATTDRNATAADLKAGKRLAEQIAGRKLDLVSTSVKSSRQNAVMQDSIAQKLENEAAQLNQWANARAAAEESQPK